MPKTKKTLKLNKDNLALLIEGGDLHSFEIKADTVLALRVPKLHRAVITNEVLLDFAKVINKHTGFECGLVVLPIEIDIDEMNKEELVETKLRMELMLAHLHKKEMKKKRQN